MAKRKDSIDVVKFILASMIIILHTIQMNCFTNYFTYGLLHMPQRLAVPLFFIMSSYFFWNSINQAENPIKKFKKNIGRWIFCYLFWSFIHLRFYWFDWYYPTGGVLWFFYALIIGNVIVFLVTRFVKSKLLLAICAFILGLFMALADAWYGVAIHIPVVKAIITSYYEIFKTLLSGFTYGILFSIVSYLLDDVFRNGNRSIKLSVKKNICITVVLLILYSIEGWYTYIHTLPKEYGFYLFMVPLCISIFTLLIKLDIKIPYSSCLGKLSTLMYYIHIMIAYHWLSFYSGLFADKSELVKDIHELVYVYVFATWIALIIYLISKKVKILRKLF